MTKFDKIEKNFDEFWKFLKIFEWCEGIAMLSFICINFCTFDPSLGRNKMNWKIQKERERNKETRKVIFFGSEKINCNKVFCLSRKN